ncbi:MAG: molybdate ABC transporter substrate-binding protein [Pseudomonadota bacterium]
MKLLRIALILSLALALPARAAPDDPPLVLAAASLQESLTAAAEVWTRAGHKRPAISFAASSTLARQVAAGAPADLFFSADAEWMDDLARRGLLAAGTRSDVLGNRLVVVARAGTRAGRLNSRAAIARTLAAGPLAMADPDSVPAGKYGRAALTRLGAWSAVAPRVVRGENVRAALALIERGAAPYGIVYATDARASKAVRIVGTFPAASHPPIVYPLARLRASTSSQAEAFRRFLTSAAGKRVFAQYGFAVK